MSDVITAQREQGKKAQQSNIQAVQVIGEIVKTTLGPKGMDKLLLDESGNITITNDGVTILQEMEISHPAAKLVVDIAKTQEKEVGDGTTTVAMLSGKFLENAQRLLDKGIHPTAIIKGYQLAEQRAQDILKESKNGNKVFELSKIAETAMTGKTAENCREHLAQFVIQAIEHQQGAQQPTDKIDINKIRFSGIKSDSIEKTELIKGIILDKEIPINSMPKKIKDGKILLVDFDLEIKMPERDTEISISSPEQLENFVESERKLLKDLTDKIIETGANIVLCQKGIDEKMLYDFSKKEILALSRINKFVLSDLEEVTCAKIISTADDLKNATLGDADIDYLFQEDDSRIFITNDNSDILTIMVHGTSEQGIKEIKRAMTDAMGDVASFFNYGGVAAGGGAIEMELARKLKQFATTQNGKEQLAIIEYACALENIPETLAENAGLDPIDILTELRRLHEDGYPHAGLNLFNEDPVSSDTFSDGIIEPLKIKTQALSSATEVACMVLRIGDNLLAKKKQNG